MKLFGEQNNGLKKLILLILIVIFIIAAYFFFAKFQSKSEKIKNIYNQEVNFDSSSTQLIYKPDNNFTKIASLKADKNNVFFRVGDYYDDGKGIQFLNYSFDSITQKSILSSISGSDVKMAVEDNTNGILILKDPADNLSCYDVKEKKLSSCGKFPGEILSISGDFIFGMKDISGNEKTLLRYNLKNFETQVVNLPQHQVVDNYGPVSGVFGKYFYYSISGMDRPDSIYQMDMLTGLVQRLYAFDQNEVIGNLKFLGVNNKFLVAKVATQGLTNGMRNNINRQEKVLIIDLESKGSKTIEPILKELDGLSITDGIVIVKLSENKMYVYRAHADNFYGASAEGKAQDKIEFQKFLQKPKYLQIDLNNLDSKTFYLDYRDDGIVAFSDNFAAYVKSDWLNGFVYGMKGIDYKKPDRKIYYQPIK